MERCLKRAPIMRGPMMPGAAATIAAVSAPTSSVHLVVYTDSTELGGAEVVLSRLLGALPGWIRVSIVGVDENVVDWLRQHREGADGTVLAAITGRGDIAGMLRHRSAFARLHPDLLQFNLSTGSSCQWAMLAAATLPRTRRIALEHSSMGVWSSTSARLKRLVERRLDAHVAVGERTARLVEQSADLPTGSIRTIHHGVDPVRPEPAARPAEPTILNVARHDPVKGVDLLLDAFALLDEPARLVLIGDGSETPALKEQSRRLGIDDRVEFRGPTWDGSGAAAVMGSFDLFVLPSRLEGFPVTVVEAMFAELPVVATDVGSVREQLTDGETGWIVAAEDPGALAAAIGEALADPAEAAARARAAHEVAGRKFTLAATVDAWVGLYRELLDR